MQSVVAVIIMIGKAQNETDHILGSRRQTCRMRFSQAELG